jgi:hypothetical protein
MPGRPTEWLLSGRGKAVIRCVARGQPDRTSAVVLRADRRHAQGGFCRKVLQLTLLGGKAVEVVWLPGGSPAARAERDLYQCVVASGLGQGFRYVRTITPAEGFAAWANKKGIRSKSNMPYICRTLSDQKPKYLLST